MDDPTILQLIRTGKNDIAINGLYHYFPPIRKLIRSRGGSTKDAEDIFQEALIILIKNVQKEFQLTSKISTYLYSVSRFLWNDQLRKRRREVSYDSLTEEATPGSDGKIALSSAEQSGLNDMLQLESRIRLAEQALNDLKERCRELLLLFYHHELSIKDITAKMGYGTENSTKNQKYKCLEAARSRLKELQHQTQLH